MDLEVEADMIFVEEKAIPPHDVASADSQCEISAYFSPLFLTYWSDCKTV